MKAGAVREKHSRRGAGRGLQRGPVETRLSGRFLQASAPAGKPEREADPEKEAGSGGEEQGTSKLRAGGRAGLAQDFSQKDVLAERARESLAGLRVASKQLRQTLRLRFREGPVEMALDEVDGNHDGSP
jgi:hypothetical protein